MVFIREILVFNFISFRISQSGVSQSEFLNLLVSLSGFQRLEKSEKCLKN